MVIKTKVKKMESPNIVPGCKPVSRPVQISMNSLMNKQLDFGYFPPAKRQKIRWVLNYLKRLGNLENASFLKFLELFGNLWKWLNIFENDWKSLKSSWKHFLKSFDILVSLFKTLISSLVDKFIKWSPRLIKSHTSS